MENASSTVQEVQSTSATADIDKYCDTSDLDGKTVRENRDKAHRDLATLQHEKWAAYNTLP